MSDLDPVRNALEAGLAPPAAEELERCVARYRANLMAEASRLEAASSNPELPHPEITGTMIRDADLLLRRGYRRPRAPSWLVPVKVGAVVGAFTTGLLADFDRLAEPLWLLFFIVAMAVTIALSVAVTLKE